MPTSFRSQLYNRSKERAQAIAEFAIVLPILIMLLVGILEAGRMIFIYSAVNNASREAARYASAVGLADGGTYSKFQYCSEIRNVARRSTFFMNLGDADIDINYDKGPAYLGSPFDSCPAGVTADTTIAVDSGDRVTVTVRADYDPLITLIPIRSRTFTSTSSRTILGVFELDTASGSGGGGGGSPTATSVIETATPTSTPAPTFTPTPTSGAVVTFTPIPPTATQVCGGFSTGDIVMKTNSNEITMTITNPNTPVTVSTVKLKWNAATGGSGGKVLTWQSTNLGGVTWSVGDNSGDYISTPPTIVTLPGNNTVSTLKITLDKNYQNPVVNGTTITVRLSTPGCEGVIITETK